MTEMVVGRLPFAIAEGGGGAERLGLVCGFLGCDVRPFNPLLAALPHLLHVRQGVCRRRSAGAAHRLRWDRRRGEWFACA
jgi:hypothetical protein